MGNPLERKKDITGRTFEALAVLLEEHYGRSNGEDLHNYATLWDTLLDALKGNTLDRDMFDGVYIRLAQEREKERDEALRSNYNLS